MCCRDDTYSFFIRPFSRFVDVEIKMTYLQLSQRREILKICMTNIER